jgi:hypothetical protein
MIGGRVLLTMEQCMDEAQEIAARICRQPHFTAVVT